MAQARDDQRRPHGTQEEAAIDALWAVRGEPRIYRVHASDNACTQLGIEHRTTKPYHPRTNGQVERMSRTIKEATVQPYHHGAHDEFRVHLQLFVDAYNYGRRLKAIRGLTPCEAVCQSWTRQPDRFNVDPSHHTPGQYI